MIFSNRIENTSDENVDDLEFKEDTINDIKLKNKMNYPGEISEKHSKIKKHSDHNKNGEKK